MADKKENLEETGAAEVDRRTLLKIGGLAAAGTVAAQALPVVAGLVAEAAAQASALVNRKKYAMTIDLSKCKEGCIACVEACKKENNLPSFEIPELDPHWIRLALVSEEIEGARKKVVPLLCNHCEHPPCVHVCPTTASFVREDVGVVLVDKHKCIGCRYCMIACPYKARSFIFKKSDEEVTNPDQPRQSKGTVDKCTFCIRRVDRGLEPACVEACRTEGGGAMEFGDMNDPASKVAETVKSGNTNTIRADLMLGPKVFYLGL